MDTLPGRPNRSSSAPSDQTDPEMELEAFKRPSASEPPMIVDEDAGDPVPYSPPPSPYSQPTTAMPASSATSVPTSVPTSSPPASSAPTSSAPTSSPPSASASGPTAAPQAPTVVGVDIRALTQSVEKESAFVDDVVNEVGKVVVGQTAMVERVLIGLFTNGHCLIEGVPGLAKTLMVKTLSR